jgi:predicted 3-demethylubiquinone-9 3-methyltransferase (glyoxalase superfamily)
MRSVATMLMFTGRAQEALEFYRSVFPSFELLQMDRWRPEGSGPDGIVKRADFRIAGHELMCFDSHIAHEFTFTPSLSLFIECESEEEQQRLYDRLSANGTVLMAMDNYGFSRRFAWVSDRFGVSWQLNLQ